jgi:hypothetical protein
VTRSAFACLALALPLGLTACGGDDKKASTSAGQTTTATTQSTPSTSTPTTTTEKSTPGVSASQQAELKAGATCLVDVSPKKIKGGQLYGKPRLTAALPGGNAVALVFYGKARGATKGEIAVEKASPKLDAYHSTSDKILLVFGRKASARDKAYGLKCVRQASAAG